MRVLVTGAGGFIGACLAVDRVRRGDDVVALDRAAFDVPGAEARVGDIGDGDLLAAALRDVEVVFHLAAAHLDQSTPDEEYRRVNVDAVGALVRRSADAGVRRVVHCSSVGVYGDVEDPPAAEDAPKKPGNVYERTKLEGEAAALAEAGAEVVVLRPAWVYGARCPRTRRLLRAVGRGRFFFFGAGRNLRHPVHIDDVLEAFHLASDRGPPGAIYNVAGPRALPLREIVACVARAQGVEPPRLHVPFLAGWCAAVVAETLLRHPPISRRSLAFFRNANAYSIAAAEAGLGFRPRFDVERGMERVVADLR